MRNKYVVVQCWGDHKHHDIYGPFSYDKARKVLESRRELIREGPAKNTVLSISPVRK